MSSAKYLTKEEISALVDSYVQRKNMEEVDMLESLGGETYLIKGLNTDFHNGILMSSINQRVALYGDNKRAPKLSKSLWTFIREACDDLLIKILIAVCIGMLIVHLIFDRSHIESDSLDSVSIIIAVILCVGISSVNNYQKERQYLALYNVSEESKYLLIQRNGLLLRIHTHDLLVGDVVLIEEGMEVPADGWIIQSNDVRIDESQITGENEAISKESYEAMLKAKESKIYVDTTHKKGPISNVPSSVLLSGSKVLSGSGKFVVLQIGNNSVMGKMKEIILGENDPTPLQEKLGIVAENIGKVGSIAAIGIVVVLYIKFAIEKIFVTGWEGTGDYDDLVNYLIIGLSTAVASIPEGLPLAVTIALAYSAKKMLRDNNLVRKIDACETMGGANAICSDKTGTLTQNKMKIKLLYIPGVNNNQPREIEGLSFSDVLPAKIEELVTFNFACNNTAYLDPASGSKTDQALLEFLKLHKKDFETIRSKYKPEGTKEFSFSSMRKRSAVIINLDGGALLAKGAAEYIVQSCDYIQNSDGSVEKLGEEKRKELNEVIDSIEISERALRPIGFAYKKLNPDADISKKNDKGVYDIEQHDLIFSAIVGIGDPLREGVPEAIEKCKKAGIKVRMITGDNAITAREIARECGILTPQGTVMQGDEFIKQIGGVVCSVCRTQTCDCPRNQAQAKAKDKDVRIDTIGNAEAFNAIYPKLDVLARARPEDKYALVVGLKERGFVVAVTGDGANDAPALIKADVGFAMGDSGTEIAKEASDIVIMDDNLTSIVQAVIWGRNVYDNIRKFLQFQLTINFSAVTLIMLCSIVISTTVFTAVQLLWINLVMDTLASLALAAEDPDENVINRPPHSRNERIISRKMIKQILGQALYQIVAISVIIFAGDKFIPENLPDVLDAQGESVIYSASGKYVRSGRMQYPFSLTNDYKDLYTTYGPTRHFTVVFNTFVFMQVFGFFAARRIDDSLNIFKGVHKSYLFLTIVVLVAGVQALLVEFGGTAVSCSKYGLSGVQWLICIGFSVGTLLANLVLKFIGDPKINLHLEQESSEKASEDQRTTEEKQHLLGVDINKGPEDNL